ncbi:TonB family protein [Alloacidobacterium sp.]|uniref:TonB family protein n=1 Tax=Alloacidobacterium sp. TaxID=2951999 RepID=UPI002D2637ED|nr:TonB family protein [Alloacidobacterium sp.]HYK35134.1 TonB family protein [Alloacidobacterium sp.]
MVSLFQSEKSQRRISNTAALSIALHALLLAIIVAGSIHARHIVIFRPMTQGSSQQIAVVAVSRGALAAVLASEHPALTEQTKAAQINITHHLPPAKPKTTNQALQSSRAQTNQSSPRVSNSNVTGQGSDAQSMYPAYPILSPSPQVRDRALLPQTTQRIIVDVDLDSSGRITQTILVKGMGNVLDQLVLDTVSAWQFHPAMVNGQPVPSKIELVFPFDRNYPEID